MVLVIILIVITLILALAAVILFANFKERERQRQALLHVEERLNEDILTLKAGMEQAAQPLGFPMAGDGIMPTGDAAKLAKEKRNEYWGADNLNKYPLIANHDGKRPPEIGAADVEKFNKARDESNLFSTLQDLVKIGGARAYHYYTRMKQLETELEIAKGQVKTREEAKPEFPKKKAEMAERLQKDIATLTQQIAKENEEYNARKAKATDEKGKAESEIAAEVEKYAADEIKVNNEIRELRRQLEELKVKEIIKHEISFVHGKILRPDVPNKIAFIDIGSRERVVPGLKFLVGKRGVQGKFEYKGKIEVKKAWMTYCEVAITEVFDPKNRPIVEGDTIVNPLFSKDRPIIVAFVGEERPVRLRYSVDEASRRIKEIGSEVRKDVGLDIDYVIFTEVGPGRQRDSYDAFKKAVFLEIPIAEAGRTKEEPDRPGLFDFLGD
jgi:hypothetical protein